ncbi:MAG: hypothetical protein JRH06_09945 [Deltaproteobacteria bacterium]|nr:hypothetical protein [Deltaproteobacteria bacterium]MBW2137865.1 hypothetical protein [Deltaproteobacteria bacterium]
MREAIRMLSLVKNFFHLVLFFILSFTTLPAPSAAEEIREEKWREWVGKKVYITYECCGQSACSIIRGATLKAVTDKVVAIVRDGNQYLIPKHMIKTLQPCK